jgi:hypothetical protein
MNKYLVFELEKNCALLDFQVQMIANNHIEGVLNVRIKRENDKIKLYHTMAVNENLKQFFKAHKVTKEQLIRIIRNMIKVITNSKRFFLYEKNFFLTLDYIFIDPVSLELQLLYLPIDSKKDFLSTFRELVTELILHVARFDKGLSGDFLYTILNYLKADEFNLQKFDEILENSIDTFQEPLQLIEARQEDIIEVDSYYPIHENRSPLFSFFSRRSLPRQSEIKQIYFRQIN